MSFSPDLSQLPHWASRWLWAAGIYNLAWGALAIAWPHFLFDLTGAERINYPEIWQCVGMFVGVYGIGYLIAASDSRTHWPNHWQIENSVFFLKDRWWDEDRHWTRCPGLSEWLAQFTTAATEGLRHFSTTNEPLRAQADYLQWTPQLGLSLLGRA